MQNVADTNPLPWNVHGGGVKYQVQVSIAARDLYPKFVLLVFNLRLFVFSNFWFHLPTTEIPLM